jgi:hypothetical protein
LFKPLNRGLWIVHLDDQFLESLVVQLNDDSVLRVPHVPEYPAAVLVERAGPENVRNIRT